MVRCARSSTSLVWGIPVHPTHLLRAIKTHSRLLPTLRALRGCHLFAPDPPSSPISHSRPSTFTVTTPAAPFGVAAVQLPRSNAAAVLHSTATFSFTPVASPPYPLSSEASTSSTPVDATVARTHRFASRRKGIASLPAEILELIEAEILLSAHEEDVPRSLVDALEKSGLYGDEEGVSGWKRICLCGERYVETGDVVRCRERVLVEVRSEETQTYLLKHFGITTAIISTPLKHSIVLLVLPHRVSSFPAPLSTMSSLPIHPPIPHQLLSTFPREAPTITGGRLPLSKSSLRKISALPPPAIPLITPSDDFIGHLHPGMFARNHWRLRNQNSGIKASVVDPAYLLLTDEKLRRFRWCVEELVLWKGVRLAREELGYEDLSTVGHFEMALSTGPVVPVGEGLRVEGNWWSASGVGDEGRGKRAKVEEDAGYEAMREREKRYWQVAVKPELWLLEELTYEP